MSLARQLDQFYTRPDIAQSCWDALRTHVRSFIKNERAVVYLEPSAGAGAFYSLMPGKQRIGLDLEPRYPGVLQTDFLSWYPERAKEGRVITAGNPPFGKNASLAVRFFNHAARFSQLIAFIVPKSFRKASVQKRLHRSFFLVLDKDLPETAFEFEGAPYDVPCCFQIWERRDEIRVHDDLPLEHEDFEFSSPDDAHFALRRVGARAGAVIEDFSGYSPASHYYIRARAPRERVVKALRSIDWSEAKANNAGNPSVSKREVVSLYASVVACFRPAQTSRQRAVAA